MQNSRFQIRTLILATTTFAILAWIISPFAPSMEVQAFTPACKEETQQRYPGKVFRLELRNTSWSKCWVPNNRIPIVVTSSCNEKNPTSLYLIFIEGKNTGLALGDSTHFDIVLPDDCQEIAFGLNACDWMGRKGFQHIGVISPQEAE